jgi:rare lipoprotein A
MDLLQVEVSRLYIQRGKSRHAKQTDGLRKRATHPAGYTEGSRTANGEKFDPHELTAAHPTLPFGTRLRVTNVATGQAVTVRVNDRGPYVAGRVVDVSQSAADALGMVGTGIAEVRLVVVQ